MNKSLYIVGGGCVLCGTCQSVCPADAVVLEADGARIVPDRCIGCGKCAENCPVEVIEPVQQPPRVSPGTLNRNQLNKSGEYDD